jgi:hypothetical protein
MNDRELADELVAMLPANAFNAAKLELTREQWQQIIAALRREPESWDAEALRVKVSKQLETIRELRQKLERPPSGEIVEHWLALYGDQLTSGARKALRAMLAAAEAEGRKG